MPEQQEMEITQEKQFIGDGFKVSEIDGEERTVTAVISSDAIDRDSEVILPKGVDFEKFEKNAVVLWSHNSSMPPIGKALWIKRQGKKIIARVQFATSDLAEEVWQLFKGGFLKAFSIGFMPTETGRAPTPAEIKKRPELAEARRIFPAVELLEFSAVAVPANPEALATAVKSGQFSQIAKDFDLEVEEKIQTKEIVAEEKIVEVEALKIEITPLVKCERFIDVSPLQVAVEGVSEAIKLHKGQVY